MKAKDVMTAMNHPPIIIEAFREYLDDSFKSSRAESRNSGREITNPNYWTQGQFVSLEGFDSYGNIVYKETQPGTDPKHKSHVISIACPYEEYKPYHERWAKRLKREERLSEIGIKN